MCGICGVVQISGEAREVISPSLLNVITDQMEHRGPNDRGTLVEPGVAFGVRRLSIVDVDGGHQPFANETGSVWGMQNGELYNHDDLQARLTAEGHEFTSRCDTEVIPHLYEKYPDSFERHLHGKFALAVWDANRRRAVIVRDRLGVKPLYYAVCGDLLVFASELKSLLASGLVDTTTLDFDGIDAYLTLGFFPGPSTPLAAVKKLMPGHRLVVENGRVDIEQYWEMPRPVEQPMSLEEAGEGVIDGLEKAVRLRLMSDVPLGAMLSGGLDSSLIVALMARNMPEPVKTFSVGFVEDGPSNELADARLIAEQFGTDHHELQLSRADAAIDLEDLVWQMDEPLADLSALGFSALSQLAADHVTVALSGQGADELLGGYAKHRAAAIARSCSRFPAVTRRAVSALAARRSDRAARAGRVIAADNGVDRMLAMSGRVDDAMRARLMRGALADTDGLAARRAIETRLGDLRDDPLPATLFIDAQLALVDDMLHYFDRASMAHSLEVRVPFLDHELVQFCAGIPQEYKVRRLTTKYLLKHSARGLIPDRIIDKRKIGFFHDSVDGWIRSQADGAIAEYLLAPDSRCSEFMDTGAVAELVRAQRAGATEHSYLLLSILMLEVWLQTFVPRATGAVVVPQARAAA
jgi:asparagine synthase (glutamine-hydrolysing)